MIGIYKITNPIGKVYVGQSTNIEKRFKSYKKLFCKNQPKLYNSLLKYGAENHIYEIITECEFNKLNENERYYQVLFNTISKDGLNCKLTNENDFNGIYCEESKSKMSKSARIKVFTKEHRANMSKNRIGEKNAMFGRTHTKETKLKISLANKNKGIETREKQSFSAKNRPKSFYENLAIKLKGKLPPNSRLILNIETGIFYNSIKEASNTFPKGKGSRTLSCKLLGKRKNNTNFIYA